MLVQADTKNICIEHIDLNNPSEEDLQTLRDYWLYEISDITGDIPLELPPFQEINHCIPLIEPDKKYCTHPPRCPDAFHSVLMDKINCYTTAGWWAQTTAPSAPPMLCIPKKSGKLRTAIDLRERNNNTIHDVTPLPDQERIRNDVARAKVCSKLDMSDAYEQIRIDKDDVHKKAFATIFGTYKLYVMQIGDCNVPATFQHLMTHIFREHIGKFMHIYLDDIFIFSNTVREHHKHLRIVFELLRNAHLYLSRLKVDTFSKHMECLGHVIDDNGIHAEEDKLERIRNWRVPRDYNNVVGFLGLVNYLSHFIPVLAAYTGPLHDICADGTRFQWRPIHQKCFKTIKALAAKFPTLSPIDPGPTESIWLICDASVSGVGLMLGIGADWESCRPAGFMSKKFTTAQHIYVTYEQETLAILEALLKWEDKLIGQKFNIITDHKTLTFLNTQKDMSYQQCRWVEYLDCFDAPIIAVEGVKNKVADALSCYYSNDTANDVHSKHEYVQADLHLDKDMEDLPRNCVEEIRFSAMHTRAQGELAGAEEKQHEEAAELAPEPGDVQAPAADNSAENPTAYELAAHEQLQLHVEGSDAFLKAVQASYKKDKLFAEVLAKPSEYSAFSLEEKLIYVKTRSRTKVLCIPTGKLDNKTLRHVVIETGHEVLGHFGPQKTSDYIRRSYWWPTMRSDIDTFCEMCH
jgi:hypothetical protein